MSRMFSVLPSCGRPTRVMIYDIHTCVCCVRVYLCVCLCLCAF